MKNYGYIPSAQPDEKCFSEQKSPTQITRALADAFASASKLGADAASRLSRPLQSAAAPDLADAGPASSPGAAVEAADSAGPPGADAAAAGAAAGLQLEAGPQVDPPKQGNDALFKYLEK